jgi:hypothetical protein
MSKQNLIFSRSSTNGELSADRLQYLAPAIFANSVKDSLSPRYAQLRTADVLPVLADHGFVPVQAAQKRSRKTSMEHTQHMVAFAHRDSLPSVSGLEAYDADANRGEIILYNSHDGSGSIKLFVGAYRFICSNGIVAGDGYQSRLYHNQANVNSFEHMLTNTVKRLPVLMERIEQMRSIQLTRDAQREMATQSALTRWKWTPEFETEDAVIKGSYSTGHTVSSLLSVNRFADFEEDAWTVFNRIQENVIRGGAMIKSFTEKNPDGSYRKSRAVNGVAENIRVNRELWDIAENICEIA